MREFLNAKTVVIASAGSANEPSTRTHPLSTTEAPQVR
jgi:hypothetical protein